MFRIVSQFETNEESGSPMAAKAPAKVKKGRPGPKPRGPYKDKRRAFTARITESTRKRLEEAASKADRSVAQEAEYRLNRSFEEDDAKFSEFGGEDRFMKLRAVARMMGLIERVDEAQGHDKSDENNLLDDAIRAHLRLEEDLANPEMREFRKRFLDIEQPGWEQSREQTKNAFAKAIADMIRLTPNTPTASKRARK